MMTDIHWPVLLQYEGDPELTVIRSQEEWRTEYVQHYFAAQDRLIDSEGQCFLLQQRLSDQIIPHAAGVGLSLNELNDILRGHFAATGHCCVAKMLVASVAEAVQAVEAAG